MSKLFTGLLLFIVFGPLFTWDAYRAMLESFVPLGIIHILVIVLLVFLIIFDPNRKRPAITTRAKVKKKHARLSQSGFDRITILLPGGKTCKLIVSDIDFRVIRVGDIVTLTYKGDSVTEIIVDHKAMLRKKQPTR